MGKLTESIPEYLEYLEVLVGSQISEIAKISNHNYSFKIGNDWFKLKSEKILGTTFSHGPCLILSSGKNIDEIEEKNIKQPTEYKARVDKIFEKLEEVYIMFLAVSNEKSKVIVKILIEFTSKYDIIEKFSSNLFVITQGQLKYCFIKYEEYTESRYYIGLKIKKLSLKKEEIVYNITDEYDVRTIINFLEFAYYSIRINDISKIKNLNDII